MAVLNMRQSTEAEDKVVIVLTNYRPVIVEPNEKTKTIFHSLPSKPTKTKTFGYKS